MSVETKKQEKQSQGLSVEGGGCDSTAFSWESFYKAGPYQLKMEF